MKKKRLFYGTSGCLFALLAWAIAIAVLWQPSRQDEVPTFKLAVCAILVALATLWLLGVVP